MGGIGSEDCGIWNPFLFPFSFVKILQIIKSLNVGVKKRCWGSLSPMASPRFRQLIEKTGRDQSLTS